MGAHPHGHEFDVFIFDGLPPQGLRFDDQGRLQFGMPSGLFAGQTFYNRGNVPPEQGGAPQPFGDSGGLDLFGYGPLKDQIDGIYNAWVIRQIPLQAGDANQDLMFDQFDLIQVQQSAKYLTGQTATWGSGDWDGAPGGGPGSPPNGDGVFDQADITAALASGNYNSGSYWASSVPDRAPRTRIAVGYDARSGEVWFDAPEGTELTSIHLGSSAGIFTGTDAQNLGGSFDNDADENIFKATFGGSFGPTNFGPIAEPNLSQQFVLGDLTVSGSLAGGVGTWSH